MEDSPFFISAGAVKPEDLSRLRSRCIEAQRRAEALVGGRGALERVRQCRWGAQSGDGRRWDKVVQDTGSEAEYGLFDGASDQCVRLADSAVKDKEALLLGALKQAHVQFTGTGPEAQKLAGNLATLFGWMRRTMGSSWSWAWRQLAHAYLADSPALALMLVDWRQETCLDSTYLDSNTLAGAVEAVIAADAPDDFARANAQQDAAKLMEDLLAGGTSGLDMARAAILASFPGTDPREAERAAKELAKTGDTYLTHEVPGYEGPSLMPQRYGTDFTIMDNCRELDRESVWFMNRWMTPEEIKAQDWNPDFVESVLAQGNKTILSTDPERRVNRYGDERDCLREVVWCFVTGIDGKGRRGRYEVVFGESGELTAFGWRLLSGRRGRWPGVLFVREQNGEYATDSRGITELASDDQGILKGLRDGMANNAFLGNVPPIVSKGYANRNISISPLAVLNIGANEDVGYMRNPEYPASSMNVAGLVEKSAADYLGLSHKDVDPAKTARRQNDEVDWFLAQATDVVRMMVEICQERASDELLASVTDDRGDPAGLRRDGIAGRFGVTIEMNADDLDAQKVIQKANATAQLIAGLDRHQDIDTKPILSAIVTALYPDIGPRAVLGADAGLTSEIEDETKNLLKIRAGVMPVMNTAGLWNYQARLGFYQQLLQQNPNWASDMGPDKKAMLQEWLKALEQMATQFGVNKDIGKTGSKTVQS